MHTEKQAIFNNNTILLHGLFVFRNTAKILLSNRNTSISDLGRIQWRKVGYKKYRTIV